MIFKENEQTDGTNRAVLEMGYDEVILDKLYGSVAFSELRVRAVCENDFAGWIVERECGGPHPENGKVWKEVARVDGQVDADYDCGDPKCEDCAETRSNP